MAARQVQDAGCNNREAENGRNQHVPVPERLRSADQNARRLARRTQAERRDTPCKRAQRNTDAGPSRADDQGVLATQIPEGPRFVRSAPPAGTSAVHQCHGLADALDGTLRGELEPGRIRSVHQRIPCGTRPRCQSMARTNPGSRHMIIETARWLNGERDPEPATMLVAGKPRVQEPVGRAAHRHLFLNRLMLMLPAMELHPA